MILAFVLGCASIGCGDDDPYRAVCDAARSMEASREGYPVDEVERRLDQLREVASGQLRADLDAFIDQLEGSRRSPASAAATERVRVVLSERCHVDLAILGVAQRKSPTR